MKRINTAISLGKTGQTGRISQEQYRWLSEEAKRRGTSRAQVIRDCMRAYQKLTPDAVVMESPVSKYVPVDF